MESSTSQSTSEQHQVENVELQIMARDGELDYAAFTGSFAANPRTLEEFYKKMSLLKDSHISTKTPSLYARCALLLGKEEFEETESFKRVGLIRILKDVPQESSDRKMVESSKQTTIKQGQNLFEKALSWVAMVLKSGNAIDKMKLQAILDCISWFTEMNNLKLLNMFVEAVEKLDFDNTLGKPFNTKKMTCNQNDAYILGIFKLMFKFELLWSNEDIEELTTEETTEVVVRRLVLYAKKLNVLSTWKTGRVDALAGIQLPTELKSMLENYWAQVATLDDKIGVELLDSLWKSPVYCKNIRQFHGKCKAAKSKAVAGIAYKVLAILQPGFQDVDVSTNQDGESNRYNFVDYLNMFPESVPLQELKRKAIRHGIHLFMGVGILRFLLTSKGHLNRFNLVVQSLEWVTEEEVSIAIKRLLKMFETMPASECKKPRKKIHGQASAEELVLIEILKHVFRFELFWVQKRWENAEAVKVEAEAEAEMGELTDELRLLRTKVSDIKVPQELHFGRRSTAAMIERVWDEV